MSSRRACNMKLSSLLSDGVVLQRNQTICIWGTVDNTEKALQMLIKVAFAGLKKTCNPNQEGDFEIEFPAMKEGGPYTIDVSCFMNDTECESSIHVEDVLIGDVWLLGGQSNMELPVARTLDRYADEVKNANNPYIRKFQVPQVYNFHAPSETLSGGQWDAVTPETVYQFSGAGYFFAVKDYEINKVPIGLLHTAQGGAHIEAFIGEERLKNVGSFLRDRAEKRQEDMTCDCDKNGSCKYCYEKLLAEDRNDKMVEETIAQDAKNQEDWSKDLADRDEGFKQGWNCGEWKDTKDSITGTVEVPNMWNHLEIGKIRGSFWLQYTVEVPKHWVNQDVQLRLGSLVDADITYVNGVEVGRTEYRYPPRRYRLPKNVLVAGKNVITVRLVSDNNVAGFKEDMPYCLKFGEEEIDLKGIWKYRIGATTKEVGSQTFFPWRPCGLYNGMIYPLHHLKLKGFLFYQGESNSAHPEDYEFLFRAMIEEWRDLFNQQDIPFVYAQLPYFMGEGPEIGTDRWERLRHSQQKVLDMPHTAMAVLYDLGQYNELHPQNKKEVAARLYDAYLQCK